MAKSIRVVYGEKLVEMGNAHNNVVVLDADVSSSTQTKFFAAEHPDRFFNMGIAEANMVSTAAGLAQQGFVPFVNTFAVFLTSIGLIGARALACYANLNVKFGGAYCGLSDAFDGASHHALEDMAIMRALPNMRVLVPSDAAASGALTELAYATEGPVYLRLSRDVYPDLYSADEKFEVGKGKIVRDGTDVTVIACGILVHKAIAAAEELSKKGISVRVVDMYSVKPIDAELIEKCAAETGAIVTAEEHSIFGGLGSAVAEALVKSGKPVPVEMVGVQDTFTESGPYAQLLPKYGLDDVAVAAAIEKVLKKK
jgi:transketolase